MATRIIITRDVDPDELGEQIEPKMRNLGNAIAGRMQRLVPKRTWALHDTIVAGTERNGAKVRTEVGAGDSRVDYEMHVERGTSRQKAQPYMRPALLQSRASDLNFAGGGPTRHGVVRVETRRTRAAKRRATSRASGADS
jgi:HK97 gp10 family phage protein